MAYVFLDKGMYHLNMHYPIYKDKFVGEYSSSYVYFEEEDLFLNSSLSFIYNVSSYGNPFVPSNCQYYDYYDDTNLLSLIDSYLLSIDKVLIRILTVIEYKSNNTIDIMVLTKFGDNNNIHLDKINITINSVLSNSYTVNSITNIFDTGLDFVFDYYAMIVPIVEINNTQSFVVVGNLDLGMHALGFSYSNQNGFNYKPYSRQHPIEYINILQTYSVYDCDTLYVIDNNNDVIVNAFAMPEQVF